MDDMTAAGDFIIVLSQMAPEANKKLLAYFPQIDLIVEGYGNNTYEKPVTIPNGVIVSPGSNGEFVGLITLDKERGKTTVIRSELIPVLDIPENKNAHNIVVEYYKNRE